MGPPDSNVRDAHQDQSSIYSELHTKKILAHQDDDILSDSQTKIRSTYESAFHLVWRMIKFKDVFPDKIETMRGVQDTVNLDQDVTKKSKCQDSAAKRPVSKSPMSLTIQENDGNYEVEDVEIVKNEEEVNAIYDDEDDVCDSITEDVGSSYNSPDVHKHDRVKTLDGGEVDEEPGGNVSSRSCSVGFRIPKA